MNVITDCDKNSKYDAVIKFKSSSLDTLIPNVSKAAIIDGSYVLYTLLGEIYSYPVYNIEYLKLTICK